MSHRIIRLLWNEVRIRDHQAELADSTFLPPFDIPFEIYDEETGAVKQRGELESCYFSSITMNDDTQEYTVCTPIQISDFLVDSEPWHVVHSEMVTEPAGSGESN